MRSHLTITDISKLILVPDTSDKKPFTHYPACYHPDRACACVHFHAQTANRSLPKQLTVSSPQRRRISAGPGVCLEVFCFLIRPSEELFIQGQKCTWSLPNSISFCLAHSHIGSCVIRGLLSLSLALFFK